MVKHRRSVLVPAVSTLVLLLAVLAAMLLWRSFGRGDATAGEPPPTPGVVVGVNVTNPHQLSPAEREAMLAEVAANDVRVIRSPLVDDSSVEFIVRAYALGIRTVAIVPVQHRADAPIRPAVEGYEGVWPGPGLSDADADRLRAVFGPQLQALEAQGVKLAAIELGNEINWAPFNGDFPVPGGGRVLGLEDLERDPLGQRVAAGYRQYVASALVLKGLRDGSRLNRDTPILSAGLADPYPNLNPGPKIDGVSIQATLAYLRASGLDAAVDAYGLHVGLGDDPAVTTETRVTNMERRAFSNCGDGPQQKPCWITEWGFANEDLVCPIDDAERLMATRSARAAFETFAHQGRLDGLLLYNWRTDALSSVFRCGELTPSGRLALAPIVPAPAGAAAAQ